MVLLTVIELDFQLCFRVLLCHFWVEGKVLSIFQDLDIVLVTDSPLVLVLQGELVSLDCYNLKWVGVIWRI